MTNYIFAPTPTFGVSEHSFVTYRNTFTSHELDQLVNQLDQIKVNRAVISDQKQDEDISDIRISNIAWIGLNSDTQWIYDRVAWAARQINGEFYKFDLYGFHEDLQYTVYEGSENGHYTWHTDSGVAVTSPPRKLTLVLQLSDPADYEGGDLEVFTSMNPSQVVKERGLITSFPSYTLHRVTPVTKGIRKTLVVWSTGAAFK
jgi:PKHD-type hydroxylase